MKLFITLTDKDDRLKVAVRVDLIEDVQEKAGYTQVNFRNAPNEEGNEACYYTVEESFKVVMTRIEEALR